MLNCITKSRRLSLLYFEYVKYTIRMSFESEHRKSTKSAKYTVLVIRARQNGRDDTFGRSPPYAAKMLGCSRVIAYSFVRRFEQTRLRKQHQDKTGNLHSHIAVSDSSRQM